MWYEVGWVGMYIINEVGNGRWLEWVEVRLAKTK